MPVSRGYYIETYGCQMNAHEAEKIAGIMEGLGYTKAAGPESADVCILNTCCIRDSAEQRIIGRIGTLKKLKAQNPAVRIAVVGCLPQQDGAAARLKRSFPFLDILLGTQDLKSLAEALVKDISTDVQLPRENLNDNVDARDQVAMRRNAGPSAYVNIMYGCNNYCSYCIVPYVRGPERSRSAADILHEITELEQQGYREVVLLGQNVNSYDGNTDFAGLLDEIIRSSGIDRIRFMTSHPKDLSDRLIDRIAGESRICSHIHLPLQSGSDAVLASMNRKYTADAYRRLTERIRSAVRDTAITTDLIVGYPGETDADFARTLDMVDAVQFDAAYTFVYSPRKGTKAAAMPEQISKEIKKARIMELIAKQNAITYARNAARIGRTEDVLVTGPSLRDSRHLTGRTDGGRTVNFAGPSELVGQIVPVYITQAKAATLFGSYQEKSR